MNDYANTYQQIEKEASVTEASPHRLIQMLLEGGLSRLGKAKGFLANDNYPRAAEQISLVIGIVDGLRASLNFEAGGEIAQNLKHLYDYMEKRLFEANVERNVEILDEVSRLMTEIKIGWDGIA